MSGSGGAVGAGEHGLLEAADQQRHALGVDVVAEQDAADLPAQLVERRGRARREPSARGRVLGRQLDARRRELARAGASLAGSITSSTSPAATLLAGAHAHLGHDARDRCGEPDLHLHRLEESERLARGDRVADRHVKRHDHRRRHGAHLADRLPAEAVRVAFHLDAQRRARSRRAARAACGRRASSSATCASPSRSGHRDVAPVEVDAVAPAAEREHLQLVARPDVRQLDLLADRRRHARRCRVAGVGEEVAPRVAPAALVGEDRGGEQRLGGVGGAADGARGGRAVEPAGVDAAARAAPGVSSRSIR